MEKAEELQQEDNQKRFDEECHSATEDAINATEKYLKTVANMKQVEKKDFEVVHTNSSKKHKEIVRNTHQIWDINEALEEDGCFSDNEVDFLVSFKDEKNYCYNSHTGLAYGDVQPTLEDAKKAVDCMKKAQECKQT